MTPIRLEIRQIVDDAKRAGKPITGKRAVDRFSMIMGNMQHKRLLNARAAARRWAA